jgi:hypothetical protein
VIVHDEKNPNGRKMSLQEFGKEAIMNHDMAIIMALGKALKDPKFVTGEVLPRKSENDSRLGRNPDADLMRMEVVLGPKSKTPTTNVVMGPAQVDPRSTNNLNGRVNNLNQSSAPQQMAETIKYDNFKGFIIALSEMGFYPEV